MFSVGPTFKGDFDEWMVAIKEAPMPTHLSLNRFDTLFTQTAFPNEEVKNLMTKRENMAKALGQYCDFQMKRNPGFSCTQQKTSAPPVPPIPDSVSRICVHNSGAYAMAWEMVSPKKGGSYTKGPTYGAYPNPQTHCISGTSFQGLKNGDLISCGTHAIAGRSASCGGVVPYDKASQKQATFTCWGSTLS